MCSRQNGNGVPKLMQIATGISLWAVKRGLTVAWCLAHSIFVKCQNLWNESRHLARQLDGKSRLEERWDFSWRLILYLYSKCVQVWVPTSKYKDRGLYSMKCFPDRHWSGTVILILHKLYPVKCSSAIPYNTLLNNRVCYHRQKLTQTHTRLFRRLPEGQ